MNRPYVAPRRVTLMGRDHYNPVHMTDMQRERAEPVLQPVEHPTLFGCDMPPWCAAVLAATPIAGLLFWLGSRL